MVKIAKIAYSLKVWPAKKKQGRIAVIVAAASGVDWEQREKEIKLREESIHSTVEIEFGLVPAATSLRGQNRISESREDGGKNIVVVRYSRALQSCPVNIAGSS